MKLLSFLFGKAEDRKQGRSKEMNQIQYIIHISQKIKTSLYVMPSKQKLLCQWISREETSQTFQAD